MKEKIFIIDHISWEETHLITTGQQIREINQYKVSVKMERRFGSVERLCRLFSIENFAEEIILRDSIKGYLMKGVSIMKKTYDEIGYIAYFVFSAKRVEWCTFNKRKIK
jgi:hypothetical protein